MRVVLAHGQPRTQRRFARVLAEAGHEVVEAEGPADALERCRAVRPDVALLDVGDSAGTLASLRRGGEAYDTAVVLIQGADLGVDAAVAALRAGAHDVLVEPVADGELVARLLAAKRTRDLQQELVFQSRRLESLVREDPLTGLANRRAILALLSGMISGARRHGRPLSVALVDLDHFKAINDAHGHGVGDRTLTGAAAAMRARLRKEDQLGRLGGEEFLALLPDTGPAAARRVGEALRAAVAAAATPVPVTASVGVATWEGETLEGLVSRADDALYAAKEQGRDRVLAAPPAAASLHGRT